MLLKEFERRKMAVAVNQAVAQRLIAHLRKNGGEKGEYRDSQCLQLISDMVDIKRFGTDAAISIENGNGALGF